MTNKEELREKLKTILGRIQGKPQVKGEYGEFVQYTYHSPHSPDETVERVMHLIDEQTRAARVDELMRLTNNVLVNQTIGLYLEKRLAQLSKDKDNHVS